MFNLFSSIHLGIQIINIINIVNSKKNKITAKNNQIICATPKLLYISIGDCPTIIDIRIAPRRPPIKEVRKENKLVD